MAGATHRFEGGCHCGNLRFVFDATAAIETLGLRADMCSFCRSHGAHTTSDPAGNIRITVRDETKLSRYRFALKTADFLVCRDCGVYIGALMENGGKMWFTINANAFDNKLPPGTAAVPHDYDGEDAPARIARRMKNWTPVAEFRVARA